MTIHHVCHSCGSERVLRDAWAVWSSELQQWELGDIFDNAECQRCDGETHIVSYIIRSSRDADTGTVEFFWIEDEALHGPFSDEAAAKADAVQNLASDPQPDEEE